IACRRHRAARQPHRPRYPARSRAPGGSGGARAPRGGEPRAPLPRHPHPLRAFRALVCRGGAGRRHRHRHGALAPFARASAARATPRALRNGRPGGRMNPNPPNLEPGQETLLELKLDELKRGLAEHAAPAAMEAALVARFRRTKPASPRPRFWWMPPIALAATIAVTSWMIRGPVPHSQELLALAPPTSTLEGDPGPFL